MRDSCGYGGMADAQDSGSCVSDDVQVQVLLPAPYRHAAMAELADAYV